VSLLGILKAGATLVPLDPAFPKERVAFIARDARLTHLITADPLAGASAEWPCSMVNLDRVRRQVDGLPASRLGLPESGDPIAYIIYTSGSTGRPKGVAVSQSSICHFLEVATPIYGVSRADRVYQGMTIAFDFAFEEIWPTFAAGATLVAGPGGASRLGPDLAGFLVEHAITVLYCVPTLLATLDRDVPTIHTLLVGGEACPPELVRRWSRPGRRLLNTYGPTETTITATWAELRPDRPVTIGVPLPGYSVHLLDEDLCPVRDGERGEICIGGPGVALGYVGRPDLTAARFVADPFSPNGRLYRSGDFGRLTPGGELEFHGRQDSQVKIRGHRVELAEIEAVLLEDAGVTGAIATARDHDVVAYVVAERGHDSDHALGERLHERLRARLPGQMVPAFIEVLDALPTLVNGKTDRASLPPPSGPRLGVRPIAIVPPATPLERDLAEEWQAVFGQEHLSVEADFFLDLGGHSLFAAAVVSRLRQNPALRHLSIADIYAHPTIRGLARHVESHPPAPVVRESPLAALKHGNSRVLFAGTMQFVLLYALFAVIDTPIAVVINLVPDWLSPANLAIECIALAATLLLATLALPVVAKWLLIGRFRPGVYPLWGWYYCRWWLVERALALAPLQYLAGSPLLPVYARLLGARVGQSCHLGTARWHVPDLIEVDDGASIGYDVELQPYVVEDGRLYLDRIRIGANAFVGSKAVLLAGAGIGAHARLGEQSLLTRDVLVPQGQDWAGSPARPRPSNDPLLDGMEGRPGVSGRWSGWLIAAYAAGFVLLGLLPFVAAGPELLLLSWTIVTLGPLWAVAMTPVAGLLFVISTCALVWAGKMLVLPHARAGVYPMRSVFGLRKWIGDRLIVSSLVLTNGLYATLYTPAWLRLLGAHIGRRCEVSTVSHVDPGLLTLRNESFVADMASLGSAVFHHGYVALQPTEVGSRSFVGNAALVRGDTRLGDDSLVGVLTVPSTGRVEPGTSWIGSPAIFLPRRQESPRFAERLTFRPSRSLVASRLAIEFVRVVLPPTLFNLAVLLTVLVGWSVAGWGTPLLALALPAVYVASAVLVVLAIIGLKWALVGRYRPRVEPLWSYFVRQTELITGIYEGAAVPLLLAWLQGTPFLPPLLRLFGADIGRRVYIDTTYLTEFDLVHVGDDAAVGGLTSLQTHLFEDRVMKMSQVVVGPGCSVGCRSVLLFDSRLDAGASLDALSLVMKGEALPPASRWRGIPAQTVE
jgi:non-ribosomal peptide synthetase-like protein